MLLNKNQKFSIKSSKVSEKLRIFWMKTKNVFNNNPLLLFYIIGNVMNGIILINFTFGSVFKLSSFLADLFVTLLFAGLYFLIKEKRRFTYLIILSIFSTIICIANAIYYYYYNSFISITFISFALTNTETGDANVLGGLFQLKYLLFMWFPVGLIIINNILNKLNFKLKAYVNKNNSKVIFKWSLIVLLLLITTLKGVDYSRLYMQWNREYVVSKFGVYLYQINDIVKSVEPQMATLFGSDQANKNIGEYYDENNSKKSSNEYTDIFKGKNVIAIHAESMQQINMNLSFEGLDVTPNLNKLASEGLYFSNFYSQVSMGTSSDTEFTVATSLMPVRSGTAFINYADRTYISFYKLLEEQGYYTASMHANTGDFWNRNVMYKALGYNDFYDKDYYSVLDEEKIGFGLSDESFVLQSVEKIKQISNEHDNYFVTMITLSNHTPFEDVDKYGEFATTLTVDGNTYPYMEGTQLGNYFKSSHYADAQLGLLIEELDRSGLLDNAIVVIYGDHDARIAKNQWERLYNYDYMTNDVKLTADENYTDIDYYWYEINRKEPLIIWSKDSNFQENYSKEVTKVMGMIDVSPTLGNMLGIYNKYALGNDIFSVKENIVALPNGNFITDKVYYNDSKGEYKLLQDVPLEEDYIEINKQKTRQILDVSNQIIVYNYFKKELSQERFVKE